MEQVVFVEQDGQVRLPAQVREQLDLSSGDQLRVQIRGSKLVLEKLKKRSRELEETLAWAKKAAQKLGQQLTPQQLLTALKPEFMQKLSEKTQLKIEELGLSDDQIEQEILEECYQVRHGKK